MIARNSKTKRNYERNTSENQTENFRAVPVKGEVIWGLVGLERLR